MGKKTTKGQRKAERAYLARFRPRGFHPRVTIPGPGRLESTTDKTFSSLGHLTWVLNIQGMANCCNCKSPNPVTGSLAQNCTFCGSAFRVIDHVSPVVSAITVRSHYQEPGGYHEPEPNWW